MCSSSLTLMHFILFFFLFLFSFFPLYLYAKPQCLLKICISHWAPWLISGDSICFLSLEWLGFPYGLKAKIFLLLFIFYHKPHLSLYPSPGQSLISILIPYLFLIYLVFQSVLSRPPNASLPPPLTVAFSKTNFNHSCFWLLPPCTSRPDHLLLSFS